MYKYYLLWDKRYCLYSHLFIRLNLPVCVHFYVSINTASYASELLDNYPRKVNAHGGLHTLALNQFSCPKKLSNGQFLNFGVVSNSMKRI